MNFVPRPDITKTEEQTRNLATFGENYFEKIVQLAIPVPPLDESLIKGFITDLYSGMDETYCEDIVDIFAVGLPNNPRKIKNSLQVFLLWQDLAKEKIKIGKIIPSLLAKIVVIQNRFRTIYNEIIEDPSLLKELE